MLRVCEPVMRASWSCVLEGHAYRAEQLVVLSLPARTERASRLNRILLSFLRLPLTIVALYLATPSVFAQSHQDEPDQAPAAAAPLEPAESAFPAYVLGRMNATGEALEQHLDLDLQFE